MYANIYIYMLAYVWIFSKYIYLLVSLDIGLRKYLTSIHTSKFVYQQTTNFSVSL